MSNTLADKMARKKRSKQKDLTPEEKKRQQRKGIIKGVAIIAIAILGTWGFYQIMIVASGTDYPMVVVVSPSMTPEINVGDLLFVHYVPPADIKNGTIQDLQGDVILYNSQGLWPEPQSDPIVHRVVGKYYNNTDGQWYFITKGDYNPNTDQVLFNSLPVPASHVLGVVYGDIPYIGYVKIWLTQTDAAIPLMIILAALLLITIIYDAIHPEEEETKDGEYVKNKKGKGHKGIPSSSSEGESFAGESLGYEELKPDRPPGNSSNESEDNTGDNSGENNEDPDVSGKIFDDEHDFV
jgi:signal peptidase I